MNKKPLVSIITPCYNGEKFIHRYFESILSQTYDRMEVIFVNDGSDDKTEEIALFYGEKLKKKGIEFQYIYQENAGQAAALNQGLKVFKGSYVIWPDSDDILFRDNIEKKVKFLEENTDCGGVISWGALVLEEQPQTKRGMLRFVHDAEKEHIFERLIFEDRVYFAPAGYMVRSVCLIDTIPQKEIYVSKCGQNWQILLPIAQKYPFGFIDECLFYYVVRDNSHSRKEKSYAENIEKIDMHEDCLLNTLKRIEMDSEERKHLYDRIRLNDLRKKMDIAYQYKEKQELEVCYRKLESASALTRGDRALYARANCRLYDWFYKAIALIGYYMRKGVWHVKHIR